MSAAAVFPDWSIAFAVSYDTVDFTSPSFTASSGGMSGGTDKATNNNIVYGFIEGYDTYCPFDICNSPPPEPSVFLRRVEKPFGLELPPGKG